MPHKLAVLVDSPDLIEDYDGAAQTHLADTIFPLSRWASRNGLQTSAPVNQQDHDYYQHEPN